MMIALVAAISVVITLLVAGPIALAAGAADSSDNAAPAVPSNATYVLDAQPGVTLQGRSMPLAVPAAKPEAKPQFPARLAAARKAQIRKVRSKLVSVARAQIGDRYSAGAAGPNAFDCSGLTRYVYKAVTGKELPHQSHSQFGVVKRIKAKDIQPGDLVFFFRNRVHHVGIYIGHNRMVDAAGYGKGVRISPVFTSWGGKHFSGAGRIVAAA